MEKNILIQYRDMKKEAAELKERIERLNREVDKMEKEGCEVTDFVKGTRRDGTYGRIAVSGFPYPEYSGKKELLQNRVRQLETFRDKLLRMTGQVEEYIESVDDSRIRRILMMRYLDGLSWTKIAMKMGGCHTADSCRNAHDRYLGIRK